MQQKRRNGRASAKTSVEDEIAHLRGLDLKGLRARWRSVFQRTPPAHLTRHLLFAIIAYRIQADRFGDLDHETKQVLDRTVAKETGPREASDRPSGIAIRRMQAMIAVKRATILLRFDWLTGLIGALLR